MKRLLSITIVFLAALAARAQGDTVFRLQRTVKVAASDFAVDPFDNLYIVTGADQLKKFGPAGDSLAVYNDVKRYGKLYSLDVSNPLKLVLFYRDFASIVVLDRLLTPQGVLDLRRHGMGQVTAVGSAYDNNIWVFDALESKLRKLDITGNRLLETVDFRQLFDMPVQPQKIIDQDGWVYLFDPAFGVYVFDHYGTFRRKYPLAGWMAMQVQNGRLVGITPGGLQFFETSSQRQRQYQFPSSFGSFSRYVVGNTRLFALGKDSLSVYSFRY
ncbi:MAG: hypothetical protein JWP27_2701 [Flaviaesturariibacter sp.]|nr:hypothetical protein [Flaviaesturariibacter sp.]